jgi:hypothetical protein
MGTPGRPCHTSMPVFGGLGRRISAAGGATGALGARGGADVIGVAATVVTGEAARGPGAASWTRGVGTAALAAGRLEGALAGAEGAAGPSAAPFPDAVSLASLGAAASFASASLLEGWPSGATATAVTTRASWASLLSLPIAGSGKSPMALLTEGGGAALRLERGGGGTTAGPESGAAGAPAAGAAGAWGSAFLSDGDDGRAEGTPGEEPCAGGACGRDTGAEGISFSS